MSLILEGEEAIVKSPQSAGQSVPLWLYVPPHLPSWKRPSPLLMTEEWKGEVANPLLQLIF